jgi:hypothetical protein
MSSIITNTILTNYPVAGTDNDSQGFRDNFTRIQSALAQAKTELINFENRAMLKTPLTGSGTVTNDLALGVIINGSYNKFYGTGHSNTVTDNNVSISLWDGIYQSFSLQQNTTITFTHWPVTGQYANIRVQVTASSSTNVSLTNIVSVNNGTVIRDSAFPALTITDTSYYILEAWSANGGVTVFVKYIGRFDRV